MARLMIFTLLAAVTFTHKSVAAQETAAVAVPVVTDPLVCVSGTMPGKPGQIGDVRLKVPGSKLPKFQALGFSQVQCNLTGKAFMAAAMAICEMRVSGGLISENTFRASHKLSLTQACAAHGNAR